MNLYTVNTAVYNIYICDSKHMHTDFPLMLSALIVFDCYLFLNVLFI